MKPLRLELEGFARFRERQTVSFEDLSLFAISGPTGAGKTLILDAICYALYGITPRLSQKLDGLIATGCERLMVELTFEAAAGTYRAVRTMERKPGGSITKATRIERLEGGKWKREPETDRLREADARLESIVGLDFAAFTRAILLPQGRFDEFLHGEARLRRSLLKDLLGLNRLDRMREEAGRRERHEASRVGFITERLESTGLADAAQRRRRLGRELAELGEQRTTLKETLARSSAALSEARTLADWHAELRAVRRELASRADAEAREDALRHELEAGRSARLLLPQLAQHERLGARVEKAETALREAQAALPDLADAARQAAEAAAGAAAQLQKEEPELQEQLAGLQELLPLARRLERLGGAPADVPGHAGAWDEDRFEKLEMLLAQGSRLEDLGQALGRSDRQAAALAEKMTHDRSRLEKLEASQAETVAQGRELSALLEPLERQLEHERLHGAAAAALRAGLETGADCPVCLQAVQVLPEPAGADDAAGALGERVQELTRRRDGLREHFAKLREEAAGLRAGLDAAATTGREAAAERERLQQEQEALLKVFRDAGFTGSAQEAATESRHAFREQLAALGALIAERTGGNDPADHAGKLTARLTELRQADRTKAEAAATARNRHEAARETAANLEAAFAELAAEHRAAAAELTGLLGSAGFADAEAVRGAAREQEHLDSLERLLRDLQQEAEKLRARQAELLGLTGGREDPGAQLQELETGHAKLLEQEAELAGNEVELRAAIRVAEDEAKEAEDLQKELRQREDERETWRVLAQDLQDNRFTDFLLADLQKRLARHAGRIIRHITDGRFDLHLSEQREFEVSDAWAGATRRTVRSLSGGETFIVSLALALALSETAAGGKRLGALFLDEGFGTLDAETLDQVAGVLENLVEDGRMVGLITHVTELSERLPARLVISRGPDGSDASWED